MGLILELAVYSSHYSNYDEGFSETAHFAQLQPFHVFYHLLQKHFSPQFHFVMVRVDFFLFFPIINAPHAVSLIARWDSLFKRLLCLSFDSLDTQHFLSLHPLR